MTTPKKKIVGTKKTPSGVQLYTRPGLSADEVMKTAKNTKNKKAGNELAKTAGNMDARKTISKIEAGVKAKGNIARTKKKPMGGK
jgi:hypothetical protein